MKFIIALILSLAIVSAQTAGGYKDVDVSGLQANPTFMNVLDNAIGQIQGADGILAGGDWSVKKINSVQEQVVAGVNYKVDVTVESSDNAQKEVILTIFYQPWTDTVKVTSQQDASTGAVLGGNTQATGETADPESNAQLQAAIDACISSVQDNQLQGE
mmetsp:Transcript_14526/g.12335  ORF Transcript_14526/g.12335 Transcript_14526/m.12335 type:complete len:159 (-) Transcript_14526:379-855(-)